MKTALQTLKHELVEIWLSKASYLKKTFYVSTDLSNFATRTILFQKDNQEKTAADQSGNLCKAENDYMLKIQNWIRLATKIAVETRMLHITNCA